MKQLALAVLAAVTLSGCAHTAPKPDLTAAVCGRAPSSYLTNEAGIPTVAITTCYRADGVLTYQARPLTAEETAQAAAALRAAAPNPAPADPCTDLNGTAYTACRASRKRSPAPLKPVEKPCDEPGFKDSTLPCSVYGTPEQRRKIRADDAAARAAKVKP